MVESPPRVLVIGFGNPLRGDDGVGPLVAGALAEKHLEGVTVRTFHQLTPEMAVDLAETDIVFFVDASRLAPLGGITVRRVEPSLQPSYSNHIGSPEALLALAQAVFGRSPKAWLVMIGVSVLDPGASLSPDATAGLEVALACLERWLLSQSDELSFDEFGSGLAP